jgi:hypothetical protein
MTATIPRLNVVVPLLGPVGVCCTHALQLRYTSTLYVLCCVSVLFLIPSHLIAFFVPTLHTHTHTIFLIFQMRNAEFLGCNFIFAVCVLFILFRLGYYLFVKEILWKHAILSLPVHLCNYQKGPPRFSSLFWSLVKKKKRSL